MSGLQETEPGVPSPKRAGGGVGYDSQGTGKTGQPVIGFSPDTETGVVPGGSPGPQCAFKVSMFNVPCNSH